MGWKMIYLARRNPALAPEQFPQAWREHSALVAIGTAAMANPRIPERVIADLERHGG